MAHCPPDIGQLPLPSLLQKGPWGTLSSTGASTSPVHAAAIPAHAHDPPSATCFLLMQIDRQGHANTRLPNASCLATDLTFFRLPISELSGQRNVFLVCNQCHTHFVFGSMPLIGALFPVAWRPLQMPPCQGGKFHCLWHCYRLEETLDAAVLVGECGAGAIALFVPSLLLFFQEDCHGAIIFWAVTPPPPPHGVQALPPSALPCASRGERAATNYQVFACPSSTMKLPPLNGFQDGEKKTMMQLINTACRVGSQTSRPQHPQLQTSRPQPDFAPSFCTMLDSHCSKASSRVGAAMPKIKPDLAKQKDKPVLHSESKST
jgi:hypothetical protein